jgi:uncharacterized protein (TIGR02266 family)
MASRRCAGSRGEDRRWSVSDRDPTAANRTHGEAPTEDRRAIQRVPVEAEVRLRFEDVQEFVDEYAGNLSLGGMFVTSERPRPVGSALSFDFRLSNDTPIVHGRGVVVWVRERPLGPDRPAGMGIRFTQVDPTGKEIIGKVVDLYIEQGGTPFDLGRGGGD